MTFVKADIQIKECSDLVHPHIEIMWIETISITLLLGPVHRSPNEQIWDDFHLKVTKYFTAYHFGR